MFLFVSKACKVQVGSFVMMRQAEEQRQSKWASALSVGQRKRQGSERGQEDDFITLFIFLQGNKRVHMMGRPEVSRGAQWSIIYSRPFSQCRLETGRVGGDKQLKAGGKTFQLFNSSQL